MLTIEKRNECLAQLDEAISIIKRIFEDKLRRSSSYVPENFLEIDNTLLSRAILDSVCRDRPFRMLSEYQDDADNLHTCG
jgi:hypothetical protein